MKKLLSYHPNKSDIRASGAEGSCSPKASIPASTPVKIDATEAHVDTTIALPSFKPLVCLKARNKNNICSNCISFYRQHMKDKFCDGCSFKWRRETWYWDLTHKSGRVNFNNMTICKYIIQVSKSVGFQHGKKKKNLRWGCYSVTSNRKLCQSF